MPIQIVQNDITKMKVDAIVNAANTSLLGGGGVDGCIHRAAGPGLLAECRTLGGCQTGQAKLTGAYRLPCRYVIHAVGPVWSGGGQGERELLASCYRTALELARSRQCGTVAFPLISSGIYGYPKDQALQVAMDTVGEFLMDHEDMTVYIVVFDRAAFRISEEHFEGITAYIDRYADRPHAKSWTAQLRFHQAPQPQEVLAAEMPQHAFPEAEALTRVLEELDEGFSQTLLRLIDQRGMTDVQCYKRANIDRKLFSKIRSNPGYRPSKPTALAFAAALELSLDETEDFLRRAGFALSRSSRFDIIVEYFFQRGIYDVNTINQALFAFDQPLLGG